MEIGSWQSWLVSALWISETTVGTLRLAVNLLSTCAVFCLGDNVQGFLCVFSISLGEQLASPPLISCFLLGCG